jgi:hypothetical protein
MTRLDFLEFFDLKRYFFGEWGTNFIYFRFFFNFLSQIIKNDQICIQWSNSYSNDQI